MMDFGDLNNDSDIQKKLNDFQSSIKNIEQILDKLIVSQSSNVAATNAFYEKLDLHDKIDYNLFLCYLLNTLYWMYLKCIGNDPSKNDVKNQFGRIKTYMKLAAEAREKQTKPNTKIDVSAAKRFIKHGIGISANEVNGDDEVLEQVHKKRKRK